MKRDFHAPGRSAVYADARHGRHLDAAGDADGARRAARRRQCPGCGDRRRRGARRGRAGNPPASAATASACTRPAGTGKVIAHQRLRPRAARGDAGGAARRGADGDGADLGALRDGPGRDLGLGGAEQGAWPQGAGRAAAAGDPLRRGGLLLSGPRGDATGRARSASCRSTRRRAAFPEGRRSPSRWATASCSPALGATLRAIAKHGAKAFYEGADRGRHGGHAARRRRHPHRGGFRPRRHASPSSSSRSAAPGAAWRCSSARRTARA